MLNPRPGPSGTTFADELQALAVGAPVFFHGHVAGRARLAARLGAAMRAFQADLSEVAHAKGAALRERLQD